MVLTGTAYVICKSLLSICKRTRSSRFILYVGNPTSACEDGIESAKVRSRWIIALDIPRIGLAILPACIALGNIGCLTA